MCRLHWQKILPPPTPGRGGVEVVVWRRLQQDAPLLWHEGGELAAVIEAKFSDVPKKRGKNNRAVSGGGEKPGQDENDQDAAACKHAGPSSRHKVKKVLDVKRSNAISILLSQMPSIGEIVAAIWALDDAVLSRDNIDALLLQMPSPEETALVQTVTAEAGGAELVTWDKPERFVLELANIPQAAERLKLWQLRHNCSDRVRSVKGTCELISSAFQQLRTSTALVAFVSVALSVGNFMNHGHLRGNAIAFELSTLNMLRSTLGPFFFCQREIVAELHPFPH
jgi:hypothetical protein